MLTAMFAVSTVICASGWFIRYISTAAFAYYLETKGYPQPNEQEIRECTQWVIKQIFKL